MAQIAVLGTGLLGAGFAIKAVNNGHSVRVWNRTASKCTPLVALGAVQGDKPADAVAGCERVHLVLKADDAVDAVIEALRPGLSADAWIMKRKFERWRVCRFVDDTLLLPERSLL